VAEGDEAASFSHPTTPSRMVKPIERRQAYEVLEFMGRSSVFRLTERNPLTVVSENPSF
jgi:hypothetical protein